MPFSTPDAVSTQVSSPTWTDEGSGVYRTDVTAVVPSLATNRVCVVLLSWEPVPTNLTSHASMTWDQGGTPTTMTALTAAASGTGLSQAWYLIGAAHNATITVRLRINASAAPSSGIGLLTVAWVDHDSTAILYDNEDTSTGSEAAAVVDVPISAAGIVFSSSGHNANAITSVSGCTLLESWDAGGNCMQSAYSAPGSATTVSHTHTYSQTGTYTAVGLSFVADGGDTTPAAPTWITTSGQTTLDTTPALDFTASDAEGHTLELKIEITDNQDAWTGGEVETDAMADSGGTRVTIHTNPITGTTWEGHQKIDDRPGHAGVLSKGGRLTRVDFYANAFESTPSLTNGTYLVTWYGLNAGMRGDATLTLWAATTAYSSGAKVKRTSTANANQRYVYECTTAGTSGGTEPTWPESPDATVSDGSVVWTARFGAGPLNAAANTDTPTPGWRARSDTTAYNPGAVDAGWKANAFSGANQIRTTRHERCAVIVDWRPNDTDSDNGLTVPMRLMSTSPHDGHGYIDGNSAANVGPYVGWDMPFRLYETFVLVQKASSTDAGFENLTTPGDTSPFDEGANYRYTVQAALTPGVYRARVAVRDTNGTNQWSAWSSDLTFTVAAGSPHYYYAQQQT